MAKTDIGKAYVQIVPSAEGIKGSITNVLSPEANAAGTHAGSAIGGKIVAAISAAGIGVALYKVISSAVAEGAALQQSIGGIETLFKDSADKMKKYADEAYKTAGVSANKYMEQATSFAAALVSSTGGDTDRAAEAANQAIIDMADNANKLGTSIDSIQHAYQGFAKQNYTMLDNLKLGYGGTKTEMERLLADAQKITGVKYDMSNLADVYEAIHVIQGELGITGTTAEKAGSTINGSLASMKSAFSNLLGSLALGEDIMPSLNALFDSTSTFLIDNLLPMVTDIIRGLPDMILPILSEGVPTILDNLIPLLNDLIMTLPEQLMNTIQSLVPTLMELGGQLLNGGLIEGIVAQIPMLLDKGYDIVIELATGIINNLPTIIEKGIEIITNLAVGIIGELPNLFSKVLNAVKQIKWLDIGKAIIDGIIQGVKNMIGSLVDTCVNAAKSAWEGVKNFFGIHSPSKKFMYIGENLALGLGLGYEQAMPDVLKELGTQSNAITSEISANMNATIKPNQSKKINNLDMTINIDNSGKDINEENAEDIAEIIVDKINNKLGVLV